MEKVIPLFLDAVYATNNLIDKEYLDILKKESLNIYKNIQNNNSYYCNIYSTINSYNLLDNNIFSILFESVDNEINNYIKAHGSSHKGKLTRAWLNVSSKNQFQEKHMHKDSLISGCFYIDINKNGNIRFFRPYESMIAFNNINEYNILSNESYYIEPNNNMLLLFKSYIPHLVEQNNSDNLRISISFNYM
jgi:uncharacterized protein (TIGR02466 family)